MESAKIGQSARVEFWFVAAMLGVIVVPAAGHAPRAWHNLPIEAVVVWVAVMFRLETPQPSEWRLHNAE